MKLEQYADKMRDRSGTAISDLVMAAVTVALDMVLNCESNGDDWKPEEISAMIEHDFTAFVNVEHYKAETRVSPIDARTPMQRIAAEETEWPTITRADVAKAHRFEVAGEMSATFENPATYEAVKQGEETLRDDILDAIAEVGLTVAFDLKPGASAQQVENARKIIGFASTGPLGPLTDGTPSKPWGKPA